MSPAAPVLLNPRPPVIRICLALLASAALGAVFGAILWMLTAEPTSRILSVVEGEWVNAPVEIGGPVLKRDLAAREVKTGRVWFALEDTVQGTADEAGLPLQGVSALTQLVDQHLQGAASGARVVAVADLVYESGDFTEIGTVHAVLVDDGNNRQARFRYAEGVAPGWYDARGLSSDGTRLNQQARSDFDAAIEPAYTMLAWDDLSSLNQHVVPTEVSRGTGPVASDAPVDEPSVAGR